MHFIGWIFPITDLAAQVQFPELPQPLAVQLFNIHKYLTFDNVTRQTQGSDSSRSVKFFDDGDLTVGLDLEDGPSPNERIS